jgi:type I restriction enzyme, S subunit
MNIPWPSVPLAEIATPTSRLVQVVPGQNYRTIGVKWWGEGAYERETIDGSRTAAKSLSIVREGDLIINKIWVRRGSTAIASVDVDGCAASGEFPTFLLDKNKVCPRWLHWLTKTREFWTKCDALSRGTSGKNRIRPEQFLTINVPLPKLQEQRRILTRIEGLIGKIQQAKALRVSAIEETDKLLPSFSAKLYDEAGDLFGVSRLGDLCVQITDGSHQTPHYVETGIPFLSVKDITSGRICFDGARRIAPSEHEGLTKRCRPERGDVLLTKVGTTGFAKAIDVDREFSIFVSLALLKLKKDALDAKFTEYMLNSTRLREYSAAGTRGVGNKNLVLKFIREFPIPTPPISEQLRIVSRLDVFSQQVTGVEHLQTLTSTELDAFVPSVLSKAFAGEL